jgi:A/G-specific adenine glycosylase
MKEEILKKFKKEIWKYYRKGKRSMPWRPPSLKLRQDGTLDPYAILVSEVMLQQTQVARVIPKFEMFLKKFPAFEDLAKAGTRELVALWRGLGYNRRALALREAAKIVVSEHKGKLPKDIEKIDELPGVGRATAAAIYIYAWNRPAGFVETNIRTVFIHHFFPKKHKVSDENIFELVEQTLDVKRPREWYYALMDYGAMLKREVGNLSRQGLVYKRQSAFTGSRREIRGKILRMLIAGKATLSEIQERMGKTEHDVAVILGTLRTEGFLVQKREAYVLYDKKI